MLIVISTCYWWWIWEKNTCICSHLLWCLALLLYARFIVWYDTFCDSASWPSPVVSKSLDTTDDRPTLFRAWKTFVPMTMDAQRNANHESFNFHALCGFVSSCHPWYRRSYVASGNIRLRSSPGAFILVLMEEECRSRFVEKVASKFQQASKQANKIYW